jgi:hypothetical protein
MHGICQFTCKCLSQFSLCGSSSVCITFKFICNGALCLFSPTATQIAPRCTAAAHETCSAVMLHDITATIICRTAQFTVFLSRLPQSVALPHCVLCTFGQYRQQNSTQWKYDMAVWRTLCHVNLCSDYKSRTKLYCVVTQQIRI